MNMKEILDALEDLETRCICGETRIRCHDFEYVTDITDWLQGKPIGHYGLLGCCDLEEEE